jgi:hydroxyacylglutathione hydrolase
MSEPAAPVLGVEAFAEVLDRGVKALDLRPLAAFARGHVPGAISLPYTPQHFLAEVEDAVPRGEVALIDDVPFLTQRAQADLIRGGYRVSAVLAGGTKAWQAAGKPLATLGQMTVDELGARLAGDGPTVIDVREPYEVRAGRIPGALHVPLGRLAQAVSELDPEREYVLVCASGARSAAAQAYLHRHGFHKVHNLAGGMMLWQAAGRPVVYD